MGCLFVQSNLEKTHVLDLLDAKGHPTVGYHVPRVYTQRPFSDMLRRNADAIQSKMKKENDHCKEISKMLRSRCHLNATFRLLLVIVIGILIA